MRCRGVLHAVGLQFSKSCELGLDKHGLDAPGTPCQQRSESALVSMSTASINMSRRQRAYLTLITLDTYTSAL